MNSFIADILEQTPLLTLGDDPILQRLCEEVIFWQEYAQQNQEKKLPADDRIQNALDFALQRLESYINSDGTEVNLRHLRHISLPKIG
jgi:hypothetical protein